MNFPLHPGTHKLSVVTVPTSLRNIILLSRYLHCMSPRPQLVVFKEVPLLKTLDSSWRNMKLEQSWEEVATSSCYCPPFRFWNLYYHTEVMPTTPFCVPIILPSSVQIQHYCQNIGWINSRKDQGVSTLLQFLRTGRHVRRDAGSQLT